MGGALMQLVAYGQQDVFISGNPEISFFQIAYKRHTNFAMQNIEQSTSAGVPGNSTTVTCTIARSGDLVGEMYLELKPIGSAAATSDNTSASMEWIAERAITTVELSIGGQVVDKHYQKWWRLYSELFLTDAKKKLWGKMTSSYNKVYLPLLFFFNRNPGLCLPIQALTYHEVRVNIELSPVFTTYFDPSVFKVWSNYIFLDTEERKRLLAVGRDYLIEQVQHTGTDFIDSGTTIVNLHYVNPVKELVWCFGKGSGTNDYWNTTYPNSVCNMTVSALPATTSGIVNIPVEPNDVGCPKLLITSNTTAQTNRGFWLEDLTSNINGTASVGPMDTFKLTLNGQDRFVPQPGKFFNQVQPYQHHTGCPYPGVYCYSFALRPEEHQPTGACNFSRIDAAQAVVSVKSISGMTPLYMHMFAVSYNVLRIKNGISGLIFYS
jgi:hypothetical protein